MPLDIEHKQDHPIAIAYRDQYGSIYFLSAAELNAIVAKINEIEENAGGVLEWGAISGTLSNQTDLQLALSGKSNIGHTHSFNDLNDKPTIPAQVNLTAGTNVTITGTYPNLTINSSGGSSSSVWGSITGTLSDQTDLNSALNGKQPLDATLTGLASLSTTNNQMIYGTGTDTFSTVNTTTGGRALLSSAGTANTIPYFSSANTVSTITTTAGGRALLNNAGTANTFPYYSAANTVSLATITPFARTILDDMDANAVKTTLGITTPTLDEVVSASGSYVEAAFPSVLMDDDGGSFAIRSHTLAKGISIDTSGTKVSRNLSLIHYGSGEYTGTVSKYLAVTSSGDVIETDAPSGGSYTAGTGVDITSNQISVKQATPTERGGTKIWKGTKSAYDALPSYDNETIYYVEDLSTENKAVYSARVSSLAPAVGGTIIQLVANPPLSIWNRTYDAVVSWTDANGLHNLRDFTDKISSITRMWRTASGTINIEVKHSTPSLEVMIPDDAKLILHLLDETPA